MKCSLAVSRTLISFGVPGLDDLFPTGLLILHRKERALDQIRHEAHERVCAPSPWTMTSSSLRIRDKDWDMAPLH